MLTCVILLGQATMTLGINFDVMTTVCFEMFTLFYSITAFVVFVQNEVFKLLKFISYSMVASHIKYCLFFFFFTAWIWECPHVSQYISAWFLLLPLLTHHWPLGLPHAVWCESNGKSCRVLSLKMILERNVIDFQTCCCWFDETML